MPKHSPLSPSGAECWLTCPLAAWWPLHNTYEGGKASHPALRGTVLHALTTICLDNGLHDVLELPAAVLPDSPECDAVNTVLRAAWSIIDKTGGEWHTEQNYQCVGPIYGTADLTIINGQHLVVVDYKFGKKKVSPIRNKQLGLYAIGAAKAFGVTPTRVDFYILQPSANWPVVPWQAGIGWIKELYNDVKAALKNAQYGGKPEPISGRHCYFCPVKAAGKCPAHNEGQTYSEGGPLSIQDFDDLGDG